MMPDSVEPNPNSAPVPDLLAPILPPPESAPNPVRQPPQQGDPLWLIVGPHGLRAGWSILLFLALAILSATVFGSVLRSAIHLRLNSGTALASIAGELPWVLGIFLAMAVLSRLERRHVRDYYLVASNSGVTSARHFAVGAFAGFLALSALVGGLAAGGWLQFGGAPQLGAGVLRHAASWGFAFLLVGLMEEGSFRCFLQYTFARGINFWWALAVLGAICLFLLLHSAGSAGWGVFGLVALGIIPCSLLQIEKAPSAGFWQAAWVTSTLFAFIHTSNNGENWIGIFAAGAIGFVFCVSIRFTGSAWWAIGCHAGWDWAETFFWGTPDSGFAAKGHLFTTTPVGTALWSGGTDGPEGSLLVLPTILLLLLILFALYGRRRSSLTVNGPSRSSM